MLAGVRYHFREEVMTELWTQPSFRLPEVRGKFPGPVFSRAKRVRTKLTRGTEQVLATHGSRPGNDTWALALLASSAESWG
jgi:hypothetical protein